MNQSNPLDLLQQELVEQRRLGNVGEASGVFLHELGNALNVILLGLTLQERQASEAVREKLAGLRAVGRNITQQMQELSRFEDSQRSQLYAVDLNAVIQAAVVGGLWETPPELALEADLPAVSATVADLQRLLRMLVVVANQLPQLKLSLTLQTQRVQQCVQLRLLWSGPENADPPTPPPEGDGHFAWIICQRVMRRLRGSLRLESGSLTADFPALFAGIA